jgi:hypothetical protein
MARGSSSRAASEVAGSPPKKTGDNTAYWEGIDKGRKVTQSGQYTRSTGDKATSQYRSALDIKKDILADLKTVLKDGKLTGDLEVPEIKGFKSQTDRNSVNLQVELDANHPAVKEQKALNAEIEAGLRNNFQGVDTGALRYRVQQYNQTYGKQLDALFERVKSVGQRYRDTDSDPMTDYYHTNFYYYPELRVAGVKGYEGRLTDTIYAGNIPQ